MSNLFILGRTFENVVGVGWMGEVVRVSIFVSGASRFENRDDVSTLRPSRTRTGLQIR